MIAEVPRTHEECLYVTWREPDGAAQPIGPLVRRVDADGDHLRFAYLKMAETLDEFRPLVGLPGLHRLYESDELFPVFAHRVMPGASPSSTHWRGGPPCLGCRSLRGPVAIGCQRATDRVEVFAPRA